MNVIWAVMIAASIIYAAVTGRMAEVSQAVTEGAYSAVTLIMSTGGIICLWSGILRAAEDSGAVELMKKAAAPLLNRLFRERDPAIMDKITQNIAANILGAGNAATPAGVSAAGMLTEKSGGKITRDMAVFTVLNTASVQIFPSTVIALRAGAGSANPCSVLAYVWITSAVSAAVALASVYIVWKNRM